MPLLDLLLATYTLAPDDERRPRVLGRSISVVALARHAMIRREDVGSMVISIELVDQPHRFLHDVVHDADVAMVLGAVGSVGMARRVEPEEMEEEDRSLAVQLLPQLGVPSRVVQQHLQLLQTPKVEVNGVGREVLVLLAVAPGVYAVRVRGSLLKHGKNVGRAEGVGVRGLVEDGVEGDGIGGPAASDGAHVLSLQGDGSAREAEKRKGSP